MNTRRRGIPFFCDFYAAAMLWKQGDPEHNFIVSEVFKHTKKVLLVDVARCVMSELRHQYNNCYTLKFEYCVSTNPPNGIFRKKGLMTPNQASYQGQRRFLRKEGLERFFTKSKRSFLENKWYPQYGGPAWGEICNRALSLLNHKGDDKDLMVKIDMVIDSAHNNGRCLDKLYRDINTFLSKKTSGELDSAIINNSQRFVRKLRVI